MWTSFHDLIFLGIDGLVVCVLYKLYKSREEVIKNILKAPSVAVGPELDHLLTQAGNEGLPYAVIRGRVHPYASTIDSPSGLKGVLQVMTLSEHSVRRHAFGHWGETVRVIQQSHNSVPFALKSLVGSDDITVEVENPFDSIMENFLLPASINFSPANSTVASTVMGFFTGHAAKGLETTEDLLPVETVITGVGRVLKDTSGHCKIGEPLANDKFPYILSTLPIESIVKRLENRNFFLKAATYFFATLGILVAARRVTKWWKVRQALKMRETILKQRSKKDLEGLSEAETCIICLTNPREILILNCGHVAVCADCCQKLDGKCPICRQSIIGTHAAYIA